MTRRTLPDPAELRRRLKHLRLMMDTATMAPPPPSESTRLRERKKEVKDEHRD